MPLTGQHLDKDKDKDKEKDLESFAQHTSADFESPGAECCLPRSSGATGGVIQVEEVDKIGIEIEIPSALFSGRKAKQLRGDEVLAKSSQGYYVGSDSLFSFLRETHLPEAQEFRLKGFNSQIPEVDPKLLTTLRYALTDARTRLSLQTSVEGNLGSGWLLDQIAKIERLTGDLSDDRMQNWVRNEVSSQNSGGVEPAELGSRRTAQSLVRRLESALQILLRVVHTLRTIDDHSTPEKRAELLVTELTRTFSSSDESSVRQALEMMTLEEPGYTAWSTLMQSQAAAWETDNATALSSMIEAMRHEAEKANKKAGVLQGDSQAFFSYFAREILSLSSEVKKVSGNMSQGATSSSVLYANTDLSHSEPLGTRLITGVSKNKLQAQIGFVGVERNLHQFTRILRHGHLSQTPSKNTERAVADSSIRSILWQWQQPAIKIQYASGAILSKVKELKKIEKMFSSDVATYDKESRQEALGISDNHLGENDLGAQVRQWVNDRIEQANPENQQAEKLAVLKKLLDGDIDNARALIRRLREDAESMQHLLKKQRFAVLKMITSCSGLDPSLKAVDKLLPDVAKDLTASLAALEETCQAAATSKFKDAERQANCAQLLATKVKEGLSTESILLTERPLDEYSRGSRLAKHWATLVKERNQGNYTPPDAEGVLSSLKKQGLLEGVLSAGDPKGYLFATRLAGELENARNDELRLPMSPEQYAALEKGLVEYIVKWGQRRVSRGAARLIIELSFEQGLDAVSFSVSRFFRLPYKVLKASIKIPYNVNKVNNHTMPGYDKPYKAMYGLLEKKLKQLGFNILTAPVPGVIKLAAGAGITASAALHNVHVGSKEKTFSAVYERLTQGKESKTIKMASMKGMFVDSLIDATTSAAFRGGRMAWAPEESKKTVFPENTLAHTYVEADLTQGNQMEAKEDSPVWESEAKLVSDFTTDIEPLSEENDQASRQPRAGRRKRSIDPSLPGDPEEERTRLLHNKIKSENSKIKEIIRLLHNKMKSEYYTVGWALECLWHDAEDSQEVINAASLPRSERDTILLRKYIQLSDNFIKRYPDRSVKLHYEKLRAIVLLEVSKDRILSDGERLLREYAALQHPIMNPVDFMDSHIKRVVAAINNTRGTQFPLDPNHKISVDLTRQVKSNRRGEKFVRRVYMTRSYTLREIVTGQFRVDLDDKLDGDQPREVYKNENEKFLVNGLWGSNVERTMLNKVKEFHDNSAKKNGLKALNNRMANLRCYEYLSSNNPKYRRAVERFLEGLTQASEVFFNGIVVEGVFMIPNGEYSGVLFNIDKPGFFEVDKSNPHIGYDIWGDEIGKPFYFPKLSSAPKLRKWILDGMPALEANQYKHASFSGDLTAAFEPRYRPDFEYPDFASDEIRPITFSSTRDRTHWGDMVLHRQMKNLEQEIDRMIHSVGEVNTTLWLERAKITLGVAAAAVSLALPGAGSTAGRIALLFANLGLDASYVAIVVLQAQNAETPEEAAAYYKEAIIAGVLAGAVNLAPGYKLSRQGIRGALKTYRRFKVAADNAVPKLLSNMQWAKLSDQGKINFLVKSVRNTEDARKLVRLSRSGKAVEQSVSLGRSRTPTGALKPWKDPLDELNRARENLKKHAKIFNMPSRSVIEGNSAAALPGDMPSYLPELQQHRVIGPKISNPAGQCAATMEPVAHFMREKGMTDIKFRGMFGWKKFNDIESFNHFVVLGSKDGKQYVFDLTAGQFAREGMPLLNGPKILSETDWAKLYQESAGNKKLFVYRDFTSSVEAERMFALPPETLFVALENGMNRATVLREPSWYQTYLRQNYPLGN